MLYQTEEEIKKDENKTGIPGDGVDSVSPIYHEYDDNYRILWYNYTEYCQPLNFETQEENLKHLSLLHEKMGDLGFSWQGTGKNWGGVIDAVDTALQGRIGEVRKAGLNIMMSMKSEGKPVSYFNYFLIALALYFVGDYFWKKRKKS